MSAFLFLIPPPQGEGGRERSERPGGVAALRNTPPGRLRRPPSPFGGGIAVLAKPSSIWQKQQGQTVKMYCGPVLRHPAKLMLPAVDLGGQVWLGGKPCKGGPAAPAFGG